MCALLSLSDGHSRHALARQAATDGWTAQQLADAIQHKQLRRPSSGYRRDPAGLGGSGVGGDWLWGTFFPPTTVRREGGDGAVRLGPGFSAVLGPCQRQRTGVRSVVRGLQRAAGRSGGGEGRQVAGGTPFGCPMHSSRQLHLHGISCCDKFGRDLTRLSSLGYTECQLQPPLLS